MTRYEATFDIDSRADASAVRRLAERLYDTLREESREVYGGESGPTDVLQDFEAIREATRSESPGELRIVYESRDEPFDG